MRWDPVTIDSQVLAIHAALVETGEILYFAGNEHDPVNSQQGSFDHSCVFNCETGAVTRIGSPSSDVFCSGHAFLGDGTLLVAGGTEKFPKSKAPELHHEHFPGLRDAWLFAASTRSWRRAGSMNTRTVTKDPSTPHDIAKTGGRWYPTLVTMPNGDVLAVGGHPGSSDEVHDNDTPEIFKPGVSGGSWKLLPRATSVTNYARLHLLRDGRFLCTNPIGSKTVSYDPWSGVWVDVCNAMDHLEDEIRLPPGKNAVYKGYLGTSVLLPLHHEAGYRQRVLVCGSARPLLLDLGASSPGWQETAARAVPDPQPRFDLNAVLLPTGEVFVCGGIRPVPVADAKTGRWNYSTPDTNAVLAAESYDPANDLWSVLPAAEVPRNYHSVALLMPDGRVWTAGSDKDGASGQAARELRIELFEPWYFSRPDRPQITGVETMSFAEAPYVVTTPDASAIRKVVFIRAGSCTHSFNGDQRYLSVPFTQTSSTQLDVRAPIDDTLGETLMPPGVYLLFLVNQYGVPSKGHVMRMAKRPSLQSLAPPLTYLDVLFGVIQGGGGVVVLPSGPKPVPPPTPLRDMLTLLVIRELAGGVQQGAGRDVQLAALDALIELAGAEKRKLGRG
jgi:hypothetical protein